MKPPDIVTQRLHNLQVTISGNCATSGYPYPDIAMKKTFCREYLRKNKIFFENILGGYSRACVLLINEKTKARKSHATVPLTEDPPSCAFT